MMSEVIIEVCELHSEGKDSKEIAEMLHMSEEFVKEIIDLHYDGFMNGGEDE